MGTDFKNRLSQPEALSPVPTPVINLQASGKQGRREESRSRTILRDSSYREAKPGPGPHASQRETAPSSQLRRSAEGASPCGPLLSRAPLPSGGELLTNYDPHPSSEHGCWKHRSLRSGGDFASPSLHPDVPPPPGRSSR